MFVHFVHMQTFTATVSGRRLRDVLCEKCHTRFHYHLDRTATGKASSPYGVFPGRATMRADKAARSDLETQLQNDHELVPCPKCHWINASAIRQFRKSRYKLWGYLALAVAFIATGVDLILYFAAQDIAGHPPSLEAKELWIVAAFAVLLISAFLIIQHFLRQFITPNHPTPEGIPRVPPGTPPALIMGPDGHTLIRAPGDIATLAIDVTWAIFRPGQLRWEPLCCQCLEPATHTYNPFLTPQKALPVPLCQPCCRRLHIQFWRRNLAIIPSSFVAGWLLAQLLPTGIDLMGVWAVTGIIGIFLVLLGFWFIDYTLKPYQVKIIDATRSVSKISFKNPAYTAILIRRIAQSDGIV